MRLLARLLLAAQLAVGHGFGVVAAQVTASSALLTTRGAAAEFQMSRTKVKKASEPASVSCMSIKRAGLKMPSRSLPGSPGK
jgi:hypothetical protein